MEMHMEHAVETVLFIGMYVCCLGLGQNEGVDKKIANPKA